MEVKFYEINRIWFIKVKLILPLLVYWMAAILILFNESSFAYIFEESYLIIYDVNDGIEEEKLILNGNI